MTVKRLKEALAGLSDDMEVVIHDYDTEEYNGIKHSPVEDVQVSRVRSRDLVVINHWGSISALSTS